MARSDSEQPSAAAAAAGWVIGDEWELHRPTIQRLYQTQKLALKEVMRIMEEKHGFRATQRMYKTRIKSWGLDKNFKESEVVELYRLKRERDRAGKPSTYMIRGRKVDWERVQSYVRRKGLDISRLLETTPPCPASSREVSARTPTPERFTSPASTTSSLSSCTTTPSSPGGARTPVFYQPQPDRRGSRSSLASPTPLPSPLPPRSPMLPLIQTPETVRMFQQFLTRVYETVMFEDGDRAWGTTEFWHNNTKSQEWIMTVRVKLALYRDYFTTATTTPSTKRFCALNRAFAILEPLSAGIIGTRLFYLVNFFLAFSSSTASDMASGGGSSNPFAATVKQLVDAVQSGASTVPSMRVANVLGLGRGSRSQDTMPPLRFVEDRPLDFGDSALRFLNTVLEEMVSAMTRQQGGGGLPKEAVLLLGEDEEGYPVVPDGLKYPATFASGRSTSPSGGDKRGLISAAEALETGVWFLARRDEAQAEKYLAGVAGVATTREGPPLSERETKVLESLARCANYHLSRICSRRGEGFRAREHMKLAVVGSLFFDSFVGWDEAEFLFA
ncbi:hypothetical protein B0T25DRAFT_552363 [Lasiosphaeria hispida]|uniref:Clr5 domain-containing protein n=1 Tax=Lasiosphaeria hispida TaxID=260671 RepID=A0AAJ0HBK5_9PEZI|nr:hypothetical protein B0T25DRAFT_552363 [Lasiosphaeria hispida]